MFLYTLIRDICNTSKSRSSGLWHRTCYFFPSPVTSTWRRRQNGHPKRWYPTITLRGVTTQKTSTWIFTAVKTSNFAFVTRGKIIVCVSDRSLYYSPSSYLRRYKFLVAPIHVTRSVHHTLFPLSMRAATLSSWLLYRSWEIGIRHWTTTARVNAGEGHVDLTKGHTRSHMRNEV